MRRAAAVLVLVALALAGCAAGPLPTAAITASSKAPTPSPLPTLPTAKPVTPSPLPSATLEPEPTPEPSPTEFVPVIPQYVKGEPKPGLRIGSVAISNDISIFYAKFDINTRRTTIVRIDRKTGNETRIRYLEEGAGITNIFLDSRGNLYYSCKNGPALEGEYYYASHLYRFDPDGDKLIASDLSTVLRVYENYIYYSTENFDTQKSGIYKFRIKDQKIEEILSINGYFYNIAATQNMPVVIYQKGYIEEEMNRAEACLNYLNLETGECYKQLFDEYGAFFFSMDGSALIFRSSSSCLPDRYYIIDTTDDRILMIDLNFYTDQVLIAGNSIFFFEDFYCSGHNQEILKYDYLSGKLLSKNKSEPIQAAFYSGNYLFLHTYRDIYSSGEYVATKNRVYIFDLTTGKLKKLADLGTHKRGDDNYPVIEVDAGFIWLIDKRGCENATNEIWTKIPLK